MNKRPLLKDRITQWTLNLPVVSHFLALSKKVCIPGFSHIPIYYVFEFFIKGLSKGCLSQRAAALSFTFFLALFPLIISFFTLIPYVPIANFQGTLLNTLSEFIPKATWDVIGPIITIIIMPATREPAFHFVCLGALLGFKWHYGNIDRLQQLLPRH